MIDVPMSNFIDFLARTPRGKPGFVKTFIKQQVNGYHPSRDYYRALRQGIIDVHSKGLPFSHLDSVCAAAHSSRQANYRLMASGYRRFAEKKQFAWFKPTSVFWSISDLQIKLNPELGFCEGDSKIVVKLYFKAKELPLQRAQMIVQLMKHTFNDSLSYCLLDVRRAELFRDSSTSDVAKMLELEAHEFIRLYNMFKN